MKNGQLKKATLLACALGALTLGAAGTADAAVGVSVGGGALKITGNAENDHVLLELHPGNSSELDVDVDFDHVVDQTIPLTDFKTISANLGGGDDSLTISDNNGAFTDQKQTTIVGGPGADSVFGGAGGEVIAGSEDRDNLFGRGGGDTISGGQGADLMSWSPGDGSDLVDAGGDAGDSVVVNGSKDSESFLIIPSGTFLEVLRNGDNILTLTGADKLQVNSAGAADHIGAAREAGTLAHLTLNAGGGLANNDNDEVIGSDSADVISAAAGSDKLDGRGGDDVIFGGTEDDKLIGGPGHDQLTGGAGTDSFECDEFGEILDLEANEPFTLGCVPPQGGGEATPTETTPAETTPAADPLGFAKPAVRATKTGLRVTLRSTGAAPVSVSLRANERFKSRRAARYRIAKRTIAAGGKVALTLRAPRALRKRIARQLAAHHRIVRRPSVAVTNLVTAGRTSVRPRLILRVR